jgi:hypothetical protein
MNVSNSYLSPIYRFNLLLTYLDRQLVLRQGGIDHHDEREIENLLFLSLEKFLEVRDECETVLIELLARNVHAEQTLIGVDLAVEFEHLLHVFDIDHEIACLLIIVLRDGKA